MKKVKEIFQNNKKEITLFTSGFLIAILLVGGLFTFNLEKDKKTDTNKEAQEKAKKKKYDVDNIKIVEKQKEYNTSNEINPISNDNTNDDSVVSYFEEQESLTMMNESDPTIRERLKNGVNTIYNFLFRGGTIKGKTFDELATETKFKILKITLSIDKKIDSYFPNYKENIKSACHDLKEKTITKYLEITNKICTEHESFCTTARDDFSTMKENFKITFSMIKEISKESKIALKEWYNNIKRNSY